MSSQSTGRVARGSACLNCRRRKMKCDAVRPICGQCIRSNRQFDCEYTDGPMPSPTQVLEESIAHLEARIHELEHPETAIQSMTLHDPHASSSQASTSVLTGELGQSTSAVIPQPQTSGPQSPEPSIDNIRSLVGAVLPHISQIGFFLDVRRFLESVYSQDETTGRSKLSPALLDTFFLWGARLSKDESLRSRESVFLARATQSMSNVLVQVPDHNVVYIIQAEVLLSTYFFSVARFLEGKHHCSAAVALVISCRLHKIRSSQTLFMMDYAQTTHFRMMPPVDAVEEGERIDAFWRVYVLDKSWALVLGTPSFIHEDGSIGASIDTPWPLDKQAYATGGFPADFRSERTVHKFLHDRSSDVVAVGQSPLALRVKAIILFERATRLAFQWRPTLLDTAAFYAELRQLDDHIDNFMNSLTPLGQMNVAESPDVARTMFITQNFINAAAIQLNGKFQNLREVNPSGVRKDILAATAVVQAIQTVNLARFDYVDSILAILWTAVCQVFQSEISRLTLEQGNPATRGETSTSGIQTAGIGRSIQLSNMIQVVVDTMSPFRNRIPLMGAQITKIQQNTTAA